MSDEAFIPFCTCQHLQDWLLTPQAERGPFFPCQAGVDGADCNHPAVVYARSVAPVSHDDTMDEIIDPNRRYHYSTWGNGPDAGHLVPDSLERCDMGDDCSQSHVVVVTEEDFVAANDFNDNHGWWCYNRRPDNPEAPT